MNAGSIDAQSAAALGGATLAPAPLGMPIDNEEYVRPATLREQPAWVRDAVLLSARARTQLERARVLVVGVLSFWEHERRRITIGSSQLSIDASGSYRRG